MPANSKHMTVDGVVEVLGDMQQKADNRFAKGGGIVFSVDGSNKISAEDDQGNEIDFPGGGTPQIVAAYTLEASEWDGNEYSLEADYPSSMYNVQISACVSTSSEEIDAYTKAKMVGSIATNSIVAMGDVPTIDILVMLIATSKTAGTMQQAATVTMLATNWDDNEYSFESDYPFSAYNLQVFPSTTMTEEQLTAFSKAQMVGAIDENVVTALGDVPAINIPVTVIATAK